MNYFENMNDFEDIYGFENMENVGKGNEFDNQINTINGVFNFFIGIFFLNQCMNIICYFDKYTDTQYNQLYNKVCDFLNNFVNNLAHKKLLSYNGFWSDSESDSDFVSDSNNEDVVKKVVVIPEVKYEDKYLDDIKKMNKEYKLNWSELEIKNKKFDELFYEYKINLVNEKYKLNQEIIEKGMKYLEIDDYDDYENISVEINDDTDVDVSNANANNNDADKISITESYNILRLSEKKELMKKEAEEEINLLRAKVTELENCDDVMIPKLKAEAHEFVIKQRLDSLKNNFILEKTPLGNVIMYWNNSRETFEYYSDNTIPYRYLETVGRKYVKTFNCRQIYFDMAFELSEFERKQKETKELKELKLLEDKKKIDNENKVIIEQKKDVFAKFKNYNKESGTGRVNVGAAPPKNSIPNSNNTMKKADENVVLKENANRYTCEGKLSNFNFLKKPDRKVIDKKYAMSFAEFKKLNLKRL